MSNVHGLPSMQSGWWAWAGCYMAPIDKHARSVPGRKYFSSTAISSGVSQPKGRTQETEILLRRLEDAAAHGAMVPPCDAAMRESLAGKE